jgi:hypothetical protein
MEVIRGFSATRERETERKNICVEHRAWSVRRRRRQMCLGFENVDKKRIYEKK